jgi:PiT family inorganic phosphate transporter
LDLFDGGLTAASTIFLVLALGLALAFEFVNGFHDTANAVATVIYTRTLRPGVAVVWSGMWNLIGVLTSSGAVAFGIVSLLPVELVLNVGTAAGFAMVFALLVSSMIWNLGTWWLGLPASSSHTLIGSIIGVGLANSLLTAGQSFGEGVNWTNAAEVGLSLLISPILGFTGAATLLLLCKRILKQPDLYAAPKGDIPPPLWIRSILALTCTGVSFAHGSNDGQKGMGLIMLILIGILPGAYALNPGADPARYQNVAATARSMNALLDRHAGGAADGEDLRLVLEGGASIGPQTFAALAAQNRRLAEELGAGSAGDRRRLRTDIYVVAKCLGKLIAAGQLAGAERGAAESYKRELESLVNFIPIWVKAAVALALGLGTTIGWKRIVITVGEKIGKAHLSYAQGASAELVAMATISLADVAGLPVSTTHVLSSGVAGTMAANRSGLQMDTVRNLMLAWVLTLPVCVLLGASLFAAGLYIVLHVAGLK